MLARLGRWLRAAGYDTRLAPEEADDSRLLQIAGEEGRVLLTRDRELAERGQPGVVLLEAERIPAQAVELKRRLAVDWLYAPFTRCVVDNAPLRAARPEEARAIPEKAQAIGGAVSACPACGRLYWEGSHHRRMARRLAAWRDAEGDA